MTKGATTVWEHWDGIMENGDFWSTDMNSFNHYAYGAVADWVYEEAAGIHTVEEAPGFERVKIAPKPDSRLDWLEAFIETRKGLVRSLWKQEEGRFRYEITTPSPASIVIDGVETGGARGIYLLFPYMTIQMNAPAKKQRFSCPPADERLKTTGIERKIPDS